MNTFTWKSIWRIRHTDEMRSILEVVLNSYVFSYHFRERGFFFLLSEQITKLSVNCRIFTFLHQTIFFIKSDPIFDDLPVTVSLYFFRIALCFYLF